VFFLTWLVKGYNKLLAYIHTGVARNFNWERLKNKGPELKVRISMARERFLDSEGLSFKAGWIKNYPSMCNTRNVQWKRGLPHFLIIENE